jgi:hypothetical protein
MSIQNRDYSGSTALDDCGWYASFKAAFIRNATPCECEHACTDGNHGKCDSVKYHPGQHTCGACQDLFSAPEEGDGAWCGINCPDCGVQCKRIADHAGKHACGSDHIWPLQA